MAAEAAFVIAASQDRDVLQNTRFTTKASDG